MPYLQHGPRRHTLAYCYGRRVGVLHERAAPGSTRQDPSTVVLERAFVVQAANELPEAPRLDRGCVPRACPKCASVRLGVCTPWAKEDSNRLKRHLRMTLGRPCRSYPFCSPPARLGSRGTMGATVIPRASPTTTQAHILPKGGKHSVEMKTGVWACLNLPGRCAAVSMGQQGSL